MAGPIFPGEVFLEILGHVKCQSTLAAFSICSQQLHGLTEKYLYAKLDYSRTDRNAHVLPAFLRTIISNPRLSLYVTEFSSGGPWYCPGSNYGGYKRDFEKQLMGDFEFAQLISSLPDLQEHLAGKPCAGSWDKGNWPSLTALLLCLLPNLNTFKVHGTPILALFRKIEKVVELAISLQNAGKASPFAMNTLERVCFENTAPADFFLRRECDHADVLLSSFHHLKSVTRLDILMRDFNENPLDWTWSPTTVSFEHVTDLTIAGEMSHESLHRFIPFFPRLKCFGYSPGDALEGSTPYSIITALIHLTNTLEHLSITTDMPALKYEFCYLLGFKTLRSIETTAHTLGLHARVSPLAQKLLPRPSHPPDTQRLWTSLPENANFVDFLPLSIEEVTITSCLPKVFSSIYKCLSTTRPPHLSRITLKFNKVFSVLSSLKDAAQQENWDENTKRRISIFRYSETTWTVIWDKEKDSNIWS